MNDVRIDDERLYTKWPKRILKSASEDVTFSIASFSGKYVEASKYALPWSLSWWMKYSSPFSFRNLKDSSFDIP